MKLKQEFHVKKSTLIKDQDNRTTVNLGLMVRYLLETILYDQLTVVTKKLRTSNGFPGGSAGK